jgi:hypothetical protein
MARLLPGAAADEFRGRRGSPLPGLNALAQQDATDGQQMTREALCVTISECEPLDGERLTRSGQVFRMGMYHANHPDGRYEIANPVRKFDPPFAVTWQPGTEEAEGRLSFGGWFWRYDLAAAANGGTQVRLTYDWSGATSLAREVIHFPPLGVEHPESSLRHLAMLATA